MSKSNANPKMILEISRSSHFLVNVQVSWISSFCSDDAYDSYKRITKNNSLKVVINNV